MNNTYKNLHKQFILEDNQIDLIKSVSPTKMCSVSDSTPKLLINIDDKLIIIKKIYEFIKRDLDSLCLSIINLSTSDPFEYNALIFCVITGLESVLNMIARLCNNVDPSIVINNEENIYFHKYIFSQSEWQSIYILQQKLCSLRFNGNSMIEIINNLKHSMPWIGCISTRRILINDQLMITDIFSDNWKYSGSIVEYSYDPTTDESNDHICFIHGFLYKINTYTQKIINNVSNTIKKNRC